MYKLIAIDLDGTLLDGKKKVSNENIDMLNKVYSEKGVIPVIVTGRPYVVAKHIGNIIGECAKKYIVAANGSMVEDNINKKYIAKNNISKEETVKIIDICEKYGFRCSADVGEVLLKSDEPREKQNYINLGQPYIVVDSVKKYIEDNNCNCFVITFVGEEKDLIAASKELREIGGVEPSDRCEWVSYDGEKTIKGSYIDIMKKGCNKANGLKVLADYLNIKKEEIMAIGDGGNDLPMFEFAGLKVVMENGLDNVKEKADYITQSNANSGVAKAIQKIIFEENI